MTAVVAPSASASPSGATPSTEPVISVVDVRKAYGDVRAVDGVSFEVGRGEIFGLLGPNGAGKTTTVEMLEGLRPPDAGELRVLGVDVARHPDAIKPRIGVALQTAALYPKLTVVELLDLFRSFYPKPGPPAADLIEALGLTERRNARTEELSGGHRQRLAVALALVNDPELVFLDEPTTGLDPAARRALWDLIAGMRDRNKTVLLTTHYMDEAEILCNRIAIMDHGRILELGTVDQLVARQSLQRSVRFDREMTLPDELLADLAGVVRIGHDDTSVILYTGDVPATIAGLLALADARGAEPRNLLVRRPTLEDVFLELTGRAIRD